MRTPGFGLSFVSLPPPSTRNGGLMLYRLLCASGPGISAPTSTLIDRNTRGFSSVYARTCGRWGSKIIASLSNNLPVNQKNRNTTRKKNRFHLNHLHKERSCVHLTHTHRNPLCMKGGGSNVQRPA